MSKRRAKASKDETTEKRSAQVEMKMPQPDRQLFYFDSIKSENAMIAKAQDRLKKIKAAAKSENVDTGAISEVLKMEKGDAVAYRRKLEQQAILMKAKGIPFQMTIYDIAFGDGIEQATYEGRLQAQGGKTPECRWPEGSPEFEAFHREYAVVNASMAPGAENLSRDEIEGAIAGATPAAKEAVPAHAH